MSAAQMQNKTNLEQVGALPWSQTTNILDQALSVRMGDGPVHIHSNFIDTIDEFTVKSTEQILLHHMFLGQNREGKKMQVVSQSCATA